MHIDGVIFVMGDYLAEIEVNDGSFMNLHVYRVV